MDAAIVVAIIGAASDLAVAAVAALLSLISFRSQKDFDRKEESRAGRAKAYSEFLSAYAETERWRGVAGKEKEFGGALLDYSRSAIVRQGRSLVGPGPARNSQRSEAFVAPLRSAVDLPPRCGAHRGPCLPCG